LGDSPVSHSALGIGQPEKTGHVHRSFFEPRSTQHNKNQWVLSLRKNYYMSAFVQAASPSQKLPKSMVAGDDG